jgi:hypothetical protein
MSETAQSSAIEGQCGTCKFAAVFDFADSPSGNEDGVQCTSEAHANMLDEPTGGDCYMQEYKDYGFLSLWRLEAIAEQSFRCANWQQR